MIDNKTIVGAMLVSRNVELLDITIPNLLKWCDWILILMDNESKEVSEKIYKFQRDNYNKIIVRRSSIPNKLFTRGGIEKSYHRRWKSCKGIIRDDVFTNLKKVLDWKKPGYDKIDILLWPDSDVIFTDYLPDLLDTFWKSNYKAISMNHVDTVGNMKTIRKANIGHHVHILKYSRDFVGIPWRFYAMYEPLIPADLMRVENYSVHLAYLTEKNRSWRNKYWKNAKFDIDKLYKLDRNIDKLSPEEIKKILI